MKGKRQLSPNPRVAVPKPHQDMFTSLVLLSFPNSCSVTFPNFCPYPTHIPKFLPCHIPEFLLLSSSHSQIPALSHSQIPALLLLTFLNSCPVKIPAQPHPLNSCPSPAHIPKFLPFSQSPNSCPFPISGTCPQPQVPGLSHP